MSTTITIPKNHTFGEIRDLLEEFLPNRYFSVPDNIFDEFLSFFWYSIRKDNEKTDSIPSWDENGEPITHDWVYIVDEIFCFYLQFLFIFNLPEFKKVYYKNYEKSEMVKNLFQKNWFEMFMLDEGKYFRLQRCWTSRDEIKSFFVQEKIEPKWPCGHPSSRKYYSMLVKLPEITKERKEFCLEIFCHPMSYEAKRLQENFFGNNQKLLGLKS